MKLEDRRAIAVNVIASISYGMIEIYSLCDKAFSRELLVSNSKA